MNNIVEVLRSLMQKYPGSSVIMRDFIKLAEDHPEWDKLSDFPPFSSFPAVDWDNEAVLKIILDSILKDVTSEVNNYFANVKKGTELNFVIDLISNFAFCKVAANALQSKFDVQEDPRYKWEKFEQDVYSQVKNKN